MALPKEFKEKVLTALLQQRENFTGSDKAFANRYDINPGVYSRLKKSETLDGLLSDAEWCNIGRELEVTMSENKWKFARTVVFEEIEDDVINCQKHSIGKIYVDECAIGKTFSAKHLSRTLTNCFYIDASQAKTKHLFIRLIAKTIGLGDHGRYAEVVENLKYYLKQLPKPILIIDEAGDLDYPAFLELKELWNATEGLCGWYLMGAEGLENKIHRGIRGKKVGYREIFSRLNARFASIVPIDQERRKRWYEVLLTQVLSVNVEDQATVPALVKKCLVTDMTGQIGGLRRARTILLVNEH